MKSPTEWFQLENFSQLSKVNLAGVFQSIDPISCFLYSMCNSGTHHTEEVMYLFYKVGHVRPHVRISGAYKIMHSLTAMCSNFAKTG